MHDDTTPASWEQQSDEGSLAYAAFEQYCTLGSQRSLRRVAEATGHRLALVNRWSREHRWQQRVRQYDLLSSEQDASQSATLWQQRMAAESESEWLAAQALLAKAHEMLACSVDAARWNWRDAAVLMEQAARLARVAAAAATAQQPADMTVKVEYVNQPDGRTPDALPDR